MKVVIAIDSFKGSMTSMQAGNAAKAGVLSACDADVIVKPLADGGEGTTEALIEGLGGTYRKVEVEGPLGEKTTARYGILEDGKTAVMEMAEAAGIILVPREKLDPWRAGTFGVGEMILDAINAGCRDFIIGIGGSATTECGIGMLTALGYEFLDTDGNTLPPLFASLQKVSAVRADHVPDILKECTFQIACDVTNPLCGPSGAVKIFGKQKGVKDEDMDKMDLALKHFAEVTATHFGQDNANTAGAGASGGLGFAFLSYLPHVTLRSGIAIVLDAIEIEKELTDADIVITGEGRLDGQTAMGKVPVGIAKQAKKHGCRVIAFAGGVTEDAANCNQEGIDAFFPIVRGVTTLNEAMESATAQKNMTLAVEQVFRLLCDL